MPKVGTRWSLGSLAVAAVAASMLLGSCSNETLGGSGAGGETGTGGFFGGGVGGSSGAGGSRSMTGTGGFSDLAGANGSRGGASGLAGIGGVAGIRGAGGIGGVAGIRGTAGIGGSFGGAAGHLATGGSPGTGGCNAIIMFPPIVAVVDATDGNPICDATFTVVSASGSPATTNLVATACDGSAPVFCQPESFPMDGGSGICRFSLQGFDGSSGGPFVAVSAPGYSTSLPFDGLYSGQGGCVPYVPAAHLVVALTPITDGAASDAATPDGQL